MPVFLLLCSTGNFAPTSEKKLNEPADKGISIIMLNTDSALLISRQLSETKNIDRYPRPLSKARRIKGSLDQVDDVCIIGVRI